MSTNPLSIPPTPVQPTAAHAHLADSIIQHLTELGATFPPGAHVMKGLLAAKLAEWMPLVRTEDGAA